MKESLNSISKFLTNIMQKKNKKSQNIKTCLKKYKMMESIKNLNKQASDDELRYK